jgi:predicted DNA-binding transcriptional regulator YafY
MRRAERLFRIVNEMRSRDVIRGAELADLFEISLSTVYRDIAHLQASGLPIEGEAGVGYLLRPGFEMPSAGFTHDQVDALAMGLGFVERTGDAVLAEAAREVRAMIQAGMPDPGARQLADAPYFSLHGRTGDEGAALVRRAIREQRVVKLRYENAQGAGSIRTVRPLVI